jgi:hypothetical protein
VKWIRSAGLGWAGHIVHIRESDPAKRSTFELLMGERTVGRSKRRWTEEVERENVKKKKSHYMPWRRLGGEEV